MLSSSTTVNLYLYFREPSLESQQDLGSIFLCSLDSESFNVKLFWFLQSQETDTDFS